MKRLFELINLSHHKDPYFKCTRRERKRERERETHICTLTRADERTHKKIHLVYRLNTYKVSATTKYTTNNSFI